jgi:hypothetical protein
MTAQLVDKQLGRALRRPRLPGAFYDLVASLDCRRVADTVDVARHVHRSLANDGTWLVVDGRDLSESIRAAGFSSVRRVAETPLHLVFEARP